jgi:hypothetical protein
MTIRMQQLFGYSGITQTAEEFRNKPCKDNFPTLSQKATALLTLLRTNTGLQLISTSISQEEFEKAFRKWSEGTSTSPSGRHLGHYRSLFVDDGHTETNEDPDPTEKNMDVYYNVAMTALNWGIALIAGTIA